MKLTSSDKMKKVNKADKFWIHEDDILRELAIPELTQCGTQYKFSIKL